MVRTLVIAEAGSSWRIGTKTMRHLEYARKCIRIAKESGADICKFQWVSDPRLMEKRRNVPVGTYTILAWPKAWLNIFAAECESVGIEFLTSVFLPSDVPTIAPFVKRFKVASLESLDFELVDACMSYNIPVLISLGAMEANQVERLMEHVPDATFLHCTATYPCPFDALNLRLIGCAFARHGTITGFSDHSGDELTGALAVARGAVIVECHFRLDETRADNPDFAHSHAPWSLRLYINGIRKAEIMMGGYGKTVGSSEQAMIAHRVTI